MDKERLIEMGLSEELAKKVMEALDGNFVTKARFNEINEENKELKESIAQRDKQLEELKRTSGEGAELSKRIEELQAANKRAEEEHLRAVKALRIETEVESAIRDAKGRNIKAVRALLEIDSESISINESGELVGLDVREQLERLKGAKDSSFLFSGGSDFKGTLPRRSAEGADVFPEKGSYEDMAAYFEAHSEL